MRALCLRRRIYRGQESPLLLGFYALGNDLDSDVLRKIDDGADRRRTLGILGGTVDEGLGNLQMVHTVSPDIVERRVLAAEIVNGDLHAEIPKLREHVVL